MLYAAGAHDIDNIHSMFDKLQGNACLIFAFHRASYFAYGEIEARRIPCSYV